MASLSKRHLFSPGEVDLAMGWPAIVTPCNQAYAMRLGMGAALDCASSHERRSLSGNGMALQQVMACLLYVSSHVIRRSHLEALQLPLRAASFAAFVGTDSADESLEKGDP